MNSSLTAVLIYIAIVFALIYGWIANIVTLFHSSFATITGELVLRVIGIFVAPLGAAMGFL